MTTQLPALVYLKPFFDKHELILASALEVAQDCSCLDGCPSCVGVGGENGTAGKVETLAILKILNGMPLRV